MWKALREWWDNFGVGVSTIGVLALVGFAAWWDRAPEPLSTVQTIYVGTLMPTSIDVNGVTWHVRPVRFSDPSLSGMTRCEKRVIEIRADASRPRETLLHELLHAQVCQYSKRDHDFEPDNLYYNSTSNDKHEGIYNIAAVVSELLARNPQLAQYEADGDYSLGTVMVK